MLRELYEFYDGRKHAFELLASRVAAEVLRESGARYKEGWLSRSSGDGGVDFIGRIDMGSLAASTPVVVLGQAKCILPVIDRLARAGRTRRRSSPPRLDRRLRDHGFVLPAGPDRDHRRPVPGRPDLGGTLAASVRQMAQANYGGDLGALLQSTIDGYGRPSRTAGLRKSCRCRCLGRSPRLGCCTWYARQRSPGLTLIASLQVSDSLRHLRRSPKPAPQMSKS